VDRGVLRGQRGGSPTVVNLSFLEGLNLLRKNVYATEYMFSIRSTFHYRLEAIAFHAFGDMTQFLLMTIVLADCLWHNPLR
jgi:hypothetical protein